MKKLSLAIAVLVVGAIAALALIAARFDSRVRPNTYLGPIQVGGLTRADAATRLGEWWQSQKARVVSVTLPNSTQKPLHLKLSALGVSPDVAASTSQLEMTDILDSAKQAVGGGTDSKRYDIKFKAAMGNYPVLSRYVEKSDSKYEPPRVYYSNGAFSHQAEKGAATLDETELPARVAQLATSGASQLELPLKQGQRVSEEQLKQIDEVVSTFTTHFPVRKKDRNTNIRIASSKINGWVLLPGDSFSFNDIVGRRTIQDGYRTAPVFKNGKHDMGVGGGICQVSSTLYNAALFSDLHIVQRHNHSMPVAYLPVGRDATVDYGSLDLAFKNTLATPIAINSEYKAGSLTFRILGKKDPSMTIKIVSSDSEAWDPKIKTVLNPSLPAGTKKVLEKGSRGRSIKTFRVVYRDGVEVAKEPLGRSYYRGGERVIAVGTKPIPATLPAPTVPMPSATPPPGAVSH